MFFDAPERRLVSSLTKRFIAALPKAGYQGEASCDDSDLIVNATDNSIYQLWPQAVLYPRVTDDLNAIMTVAQQAEFLSLQFMPRGGGTGTNGQSLNECITIDCSRHLNRILNIDAVARTVTVEPGVVLDQLNAALLPHGLVFPVEISPSKSATLGGMVSTDACGKGSCQYGKTGDYILSMMCVLASGRQIDTSTHRDAGLDDLLQRGRARACAAMPELPRGVSGYDLKRAYDEPSHRTDFNRLLAGSEGSLALIKTITLQLALRPTHKIIYALGYGDFDAALRHVSALLAFAPSAIETIDDHIMALARTDILWPALAVILAGRDMVKAMHFVEFEAESQEALDQQTGPFERFLADNTRIQSHHAARTAAERNAIIQLRKKCVGLLGNLHKDGERRPVPFVEDTAVPPASLPDYIAELRALLTRKNIVCGMFGHSDAGCLHVRPALDLRQDRDAAQIRVLTDDIVALLQKHGGILWGEHGKGMRGAYAAQLLGTDYYRLMQAVKAHFDPHNRFNPEKIASANAPLKDIDKVPMRGAYDRQIHESDRALYAKATQCNGNGVCFSVMPDDTMCPSYKATRDRRHSPKGRAALLREWLRLRATAPAQAKALSHEVYDALDGCLSCKACVSACPVHVNIPDMKSKFLHERHKRVLRPLRDYAVAWSEFMLVHNLPTPGTMAEWFGMRDVPTRPAKSLRIMMKEQDFSYVFFNDSIPDNAVLIVQDAFTSTYEPHVVISALNVMRKLGHTPLLIPMFESGKSWHVKGFLKHFEWIARQNSERLRRWSNLGVPLVGIETSMTLVYRDEYKFLNNEWRVMTLQEWLETAVDNRSANESAVSLRLLLHCSEKALLPESGAQWRGIFTSLGVPLEIVEAGCCGMAGSYGHEARHLQTSKDIYALSWRGQCDATTMVTGFSCRSQVKRFEARSLPHPVEILNQLLQ